MPIGTDLYPVTIVTANLPELINRGSGHKVSKQGLEQEQEQEQEPGAFCPLFLNKV